MDPYKVRGCWLIFDMSAVWWPWLPGVFAVLLAEADLVCL